MKQVVSPSCSFCPSDCPNIRHLFISYPQASSFWEKLRSWYSTVSNASLLLSEPEVLFGITRPCTHRLALNHLIMLGKYFLQISALNNTIYYMEKSVLLGTKPLVDSIRHFIRDRSVVFSVCHLCECRIVQ